ncbi:MAG: MBL fold metallo-hydrolase [Lachnospiraceae bacterium]|nr:MBL fold metallo-hydrolase [Lachnospiraceae bacterium]
MSNSKKATTFTKEKHRKIAESLNINVQNAENEELYLARKNLLKSYEGLEIKDDNGNVIWSHKNYEMYKRNDVPETINPSLWINGKGLYECGVFSVTGKDIIQVRGFDIANINFIRSKTGWIVLDTGSTVEGMKAAVKATEDTLGETILDKVRAVIISHSHGDHFGGIAAITDDNPDVTIYAPKNFTAATRDEYMYAGRAMSFRAEFQMGYEVPNDETGNISVGCGLSTVPGTRSFHIPTIEIEKDTTIEIDGINVDFQIASETEAVSNMQNYFHEYKALWVADNCIGTLHNFYTMRGAKVRDSLAWSQVLYDTYLKYKDKAEVVFQGHAWPHWNTEENPDAVNEVLLNHASMYKLIHDQTLSLVSQGVKKDLLKKYVKIPERLKKVWYLRPYYGTFETNIQAVYNFYLGFYDGNPIHLNPSTEIEFAQKLIQYVGSKEKIIENAKEDYEKGDYQIVAEMTGYVLLMYPEYEDARLLCADALEQLGFQTESAIWRNGYLKAVRNLRNLESIGKRKDHNERINVNYLVYSMSNEQLLKYLGIIIDYTSDDADNQVFNLKFDDGECYRVDFYKNTLLVSDIFDSSEECIEVSREEMINTIVTGVSKTENEFLEFIENNTFDINSSPMYTIAPGI